MLQLQFTFTALCTASLCKTRGNITVGGSHSSMVTCDACMDGSLTVQGHTVKWWTGEL